MNLPAPTASPVASPAAGTLPDRCRAGAARSASWPLPHEPASVPRARRLTAAQLGEWALAGHIEVTALLVGELVTNAVRHARGPLRVKLTVCPPDSALRCEVEDADPTPPRPRPACDDDEGGRGLYLVETLARRWGSTSTDSGKAVWFELHACAGTGRD